MAAENAENEIGKIHAQITEKENKLEKVIDKTIREVQVKEREEFKAKQLAAKNSNKQKENAPKKEQQTLGKH